MKKILIPGLFALLSITYCAHADDVISRSFMFTRPIIQNIAAHHGAYHDLLLSKESSHDACMQLYGIYQDSIDFNDCKHLNKTTHYFLPKADGHITFVGDDLPDKQQRDIRAEWFKLPSNFRGELALRPEQKQIGAVLEYSKDLYGLFDVSWFDDYWICFTFPFVATTNDLHVQPCTPGQKECATSCEIIEKFRQKKWCFGKIDGKRTRCELAEINFKFGKTYLFRDHFEVSYYSTVRIPTDRQQQGEYLFEAISGNNGHLGFGTGVMFQITLNRDITNHAWCLFFNLENTFFTEGKEWRSFDLKGKPWSRYILLNRRGCPIGNIPGINVLTQEVDVKPYGMADFYVGMRYRTETIEAELGYNVWGHGNERIRLRDGFPDDYGIAGSNPTITASASSIAQQAEDDETFTPICPSDLNLESGASPSVLTHKVHGSCSYRYRGKNLSTFCGVGMYYEIPAKNSALKLWGLWVKLGSAF